MPLQISWSDATGIRTLQKAMEEFEPRKVNLAGARALNRAGNSAKAKARSALIRQTGLSRKTLTKAMRPHHSSAC